MLFRSSSIATLVSSGLNANFSPVSVLKRPKLLERYSGLSWCHILPWAPRCALARASIFSLRALPLLFTLRLGIAQLALVVRRLRAFAPFVPSVFLHWMFRASEIQILDESIRRARSRHLVEYTSATHWLWNRCRWPCRGAGSTR
jgi:hypothetical protein